MDSENDIKVIELPNGQKVAIFGGGGVGKGVVGCSVPPLNDKIEMALAESGLDFNLLKTLSPEILAERGLDVELFNPLSPEALSSKYLEEVVYQFKNYRSDFDFDLYHLPNNLQLLKDLKLSPEQLDYFKNAPPHRLDGESQEDYKTRRKLNKLIVKYRGLF